MRLSSLLSTTLRQDPAEPGPAGLSRLQRAGYLRQTTPGRYAWLPLGMAALAHLESLLLAPLAPAQPVQLPPASPLSPGYGYGRYAGGLAAQAAEWPLLQLARSELSSYRQLPSRAYQVRLLTPPGESYPHRWLESWILAADPEALDLEMDRLRAAYTRLLTAWALPGPGLATLPELIGATQAWAWEPSPGRTADPRLASLFFTQGAAPAPPPAPVITPGVRTIADLTAFLHLDPADIAKVVCYTATCAGTDTPQLLMVVLRGDLEVNEAAVARLAGATHLALATEAELAAVGAVPGFASPVGLDHPQVQILADQSVVAAGGLVAGGNAPDTHLRHVQYGRDYQATHTGNLHLQPEDSKAPALTPLGGMEWAGTALAQAVGASVMRAHGRPEPLALGYLYWDLDRLLTALAGVHQDAEGLCWPPELAPFDLALISLASSDTVVAQAEALYQTLQAAGWRVLYDDRPKKAAGPGVRFKDAALRGLPLRLTIGPRTVDREAVEWQARDQAPELVPLAAVPDRLPPIQTRP